MAEKMQAPPVVATGSSSAGVGGALLFLCFHGDLRQLLALTHQAGEARVPHREASVKDVIEACGVPHPEVGAIVAAGREVDFGYRPAAGDMIEVFPIIPPLDVTKPSRLRPEPLAGPFFVVDINVAKLGRWLRMLGFDALIPENHDDAFLAATAATGRVLLTRDRRLLKRRQVVFARLVRHGHPTAQLREVLSFYGLGGQERPFTRCLRCNSRLEPMAKEEILPRLEPLTRKYYSRFNHCPRCDRIYWAGSHREKMEGLISAVLSSPGFAVDTPSDNYDNEG